MSKWRKALKNNRRFDARYFLNEKVENQEVVENSVQQEKLKKNFHDFSFNNWLDEGADKGTPSWDNDGKIDYEGDVSHEDVFDEGEETVIGDKQAKLAQLKKELEVLDREYRQAQFGSEEEAQVSMAMSRVKGKIEQLGKSDIEEFQVHPHVGKPGAGAVVPIRDEEPPVKKKKDPEEDLDLMRRSRVKQMRANAEARRNKSDSVKSEG